MARIIDILRLNIRKAVILLVALFLSLTILVATRQGNNMLSVSSTIPKNNEKNAATNNGVIITFSKPLDVANPYASFNIRPQTDGSVEHSKNELRFVPTGQLLANTTYTITLTGAKSGKSVLGSHVITFTTGPQALSAFEQTLPIVAEGYTIERLRDGTITVTITAPPITENSTEALRVLADNGVDTSKVIIIKSQSSSE